MNILIVSTLKRRVDKDATASRSRIIYELCKGLVKKGHRISLLGTKDSVIEGVTTIPVVEKAWSEINTLENQYFYQEASNLLAIKKIVEVQKQFEIIHNHLFPEFLTPLIESELYVPLITTLHIQPTEVIDEVISLYKKSSFVAISKAQKKMFHKATISDVVYNGIDTEIYSFEEKKDDYLLWLGRLSKAKNNDGSFMDPKGVVWAIELAKKTNNRLLLSGNVEDMDFFNTSVKPHLNEKIQWIGKVSKDQSLQRQQVIQLMQKAKAFIMSVNWEEPFGLVMVEAMSCGTPVIGFDRGAVSEIVLNNKTGFVVDPKNGVNSLADALSKIDSIKHKDCREWVLQHFTLEKMVEGYEKVYEKIVRSS